MNNKLLVVLILFSVSWCSLHYANEVYRYDNFETLYIQGNCKDLIIKESSDVTLKGIECLSTREVSLGLTPKSLMVTLAAGICRTIFVPQNKPIKKIITMNNGKVSIQKGSGDIIAQIKQGSINISPTIWGTTDITIEKGDVTLNSLQNNSNVLLDLYTKKSNLIHSYICRYSPLVTSDAWLWWWAHGEVNLGNDSAPKKVVKVWAKDGSITLYGY